MKPAAVVLVLSLGILSGGAPARAESPWQFAEPLPLQSPFVGIEEPGHWTAPWPARPPLIADGADLWSDYRGACIEHDLYRPRFLMHPDGERHQRPLLSAIGNWLDDLFAWSPPQRCQDDSHFDSSPTFPAQEFNAPAFSPPAAASPRIPAPRLEPVPLSENDPPTRDQPAPMRPTPVQVVPVDPAPAAPALQPPPNVIPKPNPRLGPIVELAPEPAIPSDEPQPQNSVPRNQIPRDRPQLPRNAVPR